MPLPTFEAAFGAIANGTADYVLAPIENSLAGPVHRSFDLLVESPLTIVGEVIIRIEHNLIGPPGGTLGRGSHGGIASGGFGAVRENFSALVRF